MEQPKYSEPRDFLDVRAALKFETEDQKDALIEFIRCNDTLLLSIPMVPMGSEGEVKHVKTEIPSPLMTVDGGEISIDQINAALDDRVPKLLVEISKDSWVMDLDENMPVKASEATQQ